MDVVARMDEMGKLAWIGAVVLGFVLWWPAGLTVLMFLIFTGRLRAMRSAGAGQWFNMEPGQQGRWSPWGGGCGRNGGFRAKPSGNKAFDDYREETLRRLEEEQKEFQEYLERLRQARDKAEFRPVHGGAPQPTLEARLRSEWRRTAAWRQAAVVSDGRLQQLRTAPLSTPGMA